MRVREVPGMQANVDGRCICCSFCSCVHQQSLRWCIDQYHDQSEGLMNRVAFAIVLLLEIFL